MRTTLSRSLLLLGLLAASRASAQQANVNLDWNPQKNTENLVPFSAPLNSPEVHDDRTVTFRLKAPLAKDVRLVGVAILTALGKPGDGVPFVKGEDGVFTLTVGPLRPDMYAYHLKVDGVQIADPSNTYAAFTAMPPYSQLVVHGDGPAYYDARNVPHGRVTRHVYHSDVTSGERELYVYTPPGYDRAKTYPVLTLLGGSGELPSNWIYDGRANFILDNLIAEGKAVPMVMVVPNNQVVHRNNPKHVELTFKLFEAELRQHVIPLVEREYSVRRDPRGRALAGLSMGGRHTLFVGLNSLDLFASFGVLSAGDVDAETSLARFLGTPDVNQKLAYLFVGQGTAEAEGPLGARVAALVAALKAHGIRHEYYVGGYGGHDWATWRHLLYARFLPGLWRESPEAAPARPAPVRTESGLVQGVQEKDLAVYRGIPYAAPPLGELRWRPPQPAPRWDGVRPAETFGPDPYQGDGKGNVGEDCLSLNVWTPARSPGDRVPVLVWIYGGGFSFGSTSTPVHDGATLAGKGVVLVSINYRVGSLGFLAHPELSAESANKTSGNYGLLDLIAGLQWVKKNIAAFGGDPGRVTIFGESAGGIAVSMLSASPLAKGLFQGAISQSGGSFGPPRPTTYPGENMRRLADAEQAGVAFAQKAGAASIAELRKLDPAKLPAGFGSGAAWPIIDGFVIPDDQHKLYEAGRYNDVALLVGYNSDEGLSFSREKTAAEYQENVRKRFGPFADKLLAAYPASADGVPKTARDLMRDAAFGWQTWAWARLAARTGKSKVFYYYFDQHPERAAGSPQADHGMPHGVDVPYVFGTLDRNDARRTPGDWAISETVSTFWTNFAKHGDPNGPSVPLWPRFTESDRRVMYFQNEARPAPVPSAGALEVLDAYFAWRRTPEGEAWAR
jgi:para-nitrobenzyl esterase